MRTHTGHWSISDALAQHETLGVEGEKRSAEEEPVVLRLYSLGLMVL